MSFSSTLSSNRKYLSLLAVVAGLVFSSFQLARGEDEFPPDDIDRKAAAPVDSQVPVTQPYDSSIPPYRLRLGVHVQPYSAHTSNGRLEGGRVTSDELSRPLFTRDRYGNWQKMRFRVGYDVILSVNANPVRNANDVTNSLIPGWNELRIWDAATRVTGNYYVKIYEAVPSYPASANPAP